jgi:ribosomal protein S18 acetylase RimI-like enzyme
MEELVPLTIRAYGRGDELSWLRCRVLSFLDTSYYDDVAASKPRYERGVELVAVHDDEVVGIFDASVDNNDAVLECIAVHPDYRRQGVGRRLLAQGLPKLRNLGGTRLTAWTREDLSANAWYLSLGFVETFSYLHVFAEGDTEVSKVVRVDDGLVPVKVFLHAKADREAALRTEFARVYKCRSYESDLTVIDETVQASGHVV